MDKFLRKLALILLIASVSVNGSAAAENIDTDVDGSTSLIRCLEHGNGEFDAFINALIFSDGFFEGVIEPWNDIIDRNQCHATDVLALGKQLNRIRDRIRDAYLTCDPDNDIAAMKKQYYSLTAEVYYARHIVDADTAEDLSSEELKDPVRVEQLFADRDVLYNEMKARYVGNDGLSSRDFDILFLQLEGKYKERKYFYVVCDSGEWEQVEIKWDEFVENLKGIIENAGETIGARASEISDEAKSMKVVEMFSSDETSFGDYAASFFRMNLNGLGPEEGFGEIADEFLGNLPAGNVATPESLLREIGSAGRTRDIAEMRVKMQSNFATLYGNASDGTTQLFVETLGGNGGFVQILEESIPPIDKLTERSDELNARQCPAK